jgi:hypothetical protein
MDFLKDRQICFHWFFKRFISLIVYSYHNPHKKWFIVLIFFYLIEINLCRCTNCFIGKKKYLVIMSPKWSCVCSVSYYYYITQTIVGWCIVILRFFFTIIITSPQLLSSDVLLFYVSFSLLLLCLPFERRETYCFSLIFSSSASASSQRNLSRP